MITILELFAGCGGLAQGFSQVDGYKILYANEFDEVIAETYRLNHPGVVISTTDIVSLMPEKVEKNLKTKSIDLIIGGPPCQGFSTSGKRDKKDPRNSLFMEFIRFVQYFQPKAVLMENVSGILSMETQAKTKVFDVIKAEFANIGYKVEAQLLNAAEYGVPQVRKRTIFLGNRMGWPVSFPHPTHTEQEFVTLREAISDLKSLSSNEKDPKDVLHFAIEHSKNHLQMMKYLLEGDAACNIEDESIRPTSGFNNQYARLWWDKPGMTITRAFQCVSSCRCIHPTDNRALTIREAARIQTFPDSYKFNGATTSIRLQIGNAVPPLLAKVLAQHLKETWFDKQLQNKGNPQQ